MRGMNSGFAWNSKTHVASFDVSVTDSNGRRHRHRTTEDGHASRADALKAWSIFRDRVRAGKEERTVHTLRTYFETHWPAMKKTLSPKSLASAVSYTHLTLPT